ncbi:hypothetical protein [Natranaerobius trueperi]|uniref:S-layer protein n=1 Tax=Natranaerobius trueperi TaxID=759412 RepID=A0A226C0B4_9FIRM|nr:hypothetical protein [Natranaerobius trueperi]OWZ84666.1 hypothetical protein CDO51_02580 [Natranaerobius trueperi]
MNKRLMFLFTLLFLMTVVIGQTYAVDSYFGNTIEGYLQQLDDEELVIETYEGEEYSFSYDNDTNFLIDGYHVERQEFNNGMEITASVGVDNYISELEGYSTEDPGYIPPGSRVEFGTVVDIDGDEIEIINDIGETKTYFTSFNTTVNISGRVGEMNDIYVGDRLRLHFDSINDNVISEINVQGHGAKVTDLYRGEIGIARNFGSRVNLVNLEVFRNGKWHQINNRLRESYDNFDIYLNGKEVDNLEDHRGRTAYMVMEEFFGEDRVKKMVLQSDNEIRYSTQIENINWYSETFELTNNRNFNFNDGTMVVQNDRLINHKSLSPKSDAYVIGDGRGSHRTANIVYVYDQAINHSNVGENYIYAGRLDSIDKDRLWIDDFSLLRDHVWNKFDDNKELFIHDDTDIYNNEKDESVSRREFYHEDYHDKYGYIYTDGDDVEAILVEDSLSSLLEKRITNGTVNSIKEDELAGTQIEIYDARDWSSKRTEWVPKTVNLDILVENSMIIKDGEQISPEKLQEGDSLYIIREENEAKLVLVN